MPKFENEFTILPGSIGSIKSNFHGFLWTHSISWSLKVFLTLLLVIDVFKNLDRNHSSQVSPEK